MKVSIVTISYNQVKFLERAIRSVIEQDYDDIEYIVVDAGSTDGSRQIIERYQPRIAKVIFEPDHGQPDGLNKGSAQATGEIFGYIYADDAYLPGAIRKAVQAFLADPTASAVYAHGYIIDHNGNVLRRFRSDPFDLHRYAFGGVVVMQQTTFFKRRAFEEVGGFNRDNQTCWDGELLLDLAHAGKRFKLVNDYWSVFTIHPESISGSGRLNKRYRQDQRRLFEKVVGRRPGPLDPALRIVARFQKWLLSPATPCLQLLEKLVGPPEVELS